MTVGDWPIDITIRGTGFDVPKGHWRRCQGRTFAGEQCGKWAVGGRAYCRRHGGARKSFEQRWADRMSVYAKNAGPRLQQVLADLAAQGHERMSLASEIDVARMSAIEAMKLYSALVENEKATEGVKIAAAEHLRSAIECVGDMAVRAAKIRAASEEVIHVEAIDYVVVQVGRIVNDVVGSRSPELAELLMQALSTDIKLPERRGPAALAEPDESFL